MPKSYTFSSEQKTEIEDAIKSANDKKCYKRLQVLKLRCDGRKNNEISKITGYCYSNICILISKYFKMGISAITEDKRTGNNRKLTFKEEQELLAPFEKDAKNGKMLVVADIKAAFDKKIGITSSIPTIYKLIKRHDWRKIMPRSQHPKKATPEAIEAYKKNRL
jgi:transposase